MSAAEARRIAAEMERVMLAVPRRVRETLPEEEDLDESYRLWRAALRADAEYQAVRADWELATWREAE